MSVEPFPPLTQPHPWPPPGRSADAFDRIPFLGALSRSVYELFAGRPYWKLLDDIEEQIVSQLQSRVAPHPGWPSDQATKIVLSALEEAVCFWKGIDRFYGHPHDRAVLVLWGAYDDLSPFSFQDALRRKLHNKTLPDLLTACLFGPMQATGEYNYRESMTSRTTLCELVECYADWIRERKDSIHAD